MPTSTLKYRYNPLHQDIICSETAIDDLPSTVDSLAACPRNTVGEWLGV